MSNGLNTELRTTRSDRGVVSLATDVLTDLFGLSQETADEVMNYIRAHGEYSDMKRNLRNLSGTTYNRLNQVLDLAQGDRDMAGEEMPEEEPEDEYSAPETGMREETPAEFKMEGKMNEKFKSPEGLPGQKGHDPKSMRDWAKKAVKKARKDNAGDSSVGSKKEKVQDLFEKKPTFLNYLLNEQNIRQLTQQQMAMIGDREERVKRSKMNDVELRKQVASDIADLANSNDPEDRRILALRKQLAAAQERKAQKKEAEQQTTGVTGPTSTV